MRSLLAGVPALLLAACIFTAAPAAGSQPLFLAVTQFPDGQELARMALQGEDGFSLSFIHSVSNTRVKDIYQIRSGSIVQVAERFKTHGAGLPTSPEEPGGLAWEQEGEEFILKMERPISRLVIRTDKNYQNRLIIGNRTINLNQWKDQALLLQILPGGP